MASFLCDSKGFEHSWLLRNAESISREVRNTWQWEISSQGQNPTISVKRTLRMSNPVMYSYHMSYLTSLSHFSYIVIFSHFCLTFPKRKPDTLQSQTPCMRPVFLESHYSKKEIWKKHVRRQVHLETLVFQQTTCVEESSVWRQGAAALLESSPEHCNC